MITLRLYPLFIFLFLIFFSSCEESNAINAKDLIIKNGVYYEVGKSVPFTGKAITYNERKQKVSEKNYENGKLHGAYFYWYQDGHTMRGFYRNGKETGVWTLFDQNGNEISRKVYN